MAGFLIREWVRGKLKREYFQLWARQGSNLWLLPCEGSTLPLSYAPFVAEGDTALPRAPIWKQWIHRSLRGVNPSSLAICSQI